jgi:hypothetical protein
MRRIPAVALILILAACGSDPATPTTPPSSGTNAVTVSAVSPAPGATVAVPERYPYNVLGGVVLPPGSGVMSAQVTMSVARDVPYAQLNVYLMTGPGAADYCGQNLPDSPTWPSLPAGWTSTVTITGFQVFQLPCEVTGLRAMLHTRNSNSGLVTPPTAEQTIAVATAPASFRLTR